MATITIPAVHSGQIQALGLRKPLAKLSIKRVTTAVRKYLRVQKFAAVVSCDAVWVNGSWHGTCTLGNVSHPFQVS